MRFRLKNISNDIVELGDLGFTLDPGSIAETTEDVGQSNDVQYHINSQNVVFVGSDDIEMTNDETAAFLGDQALMENEKYYSKREINDKFDQIANSAPGMLDTLGELADALGNDASFASTMTQALNEKAGSDHDHDLNYASLSHEHSLQYYGISTIDSLLSQKAAAEHLHPQYLRGDHNHTGVYAAVRHDHDDRYVRRGEPGNNPTPVFGSNFALAERTAPFTVSGPTMTECVRLKVSVEKRGMYRLGISYMWAFDHSRYDFMAQVLHIGERAKQIIYTHQEQPTSSAGYNGNIGTDQKHTATKTKYLMLEPGTNTFILSISSYGRMRVKASIWDANLEFWRTQ